MTDTTEVTNENVDQLLEQQKDAPVAPPAEDAATDETPAEKKHDGPEPKVPLGALHEERMRRKAAEADRANLTRELEEQRRWRQEKGAVLEERLAALQPRQQIDPVENPVGYLATQQAETQKMLADMQQRQKQQDEYGQSIAAAQQFKMFVENDEAGFSRQNPDYFQAVKHARDFKAKEYMTFGYTEQQAQELVTNDAIAISQRALQLGESPANLFYQYAKNVGFKSAVSGEQKLNMMEAGQKASKPTGGGGKSPALTLDALASMSNEEFARATADENAFRKLMGG